MGAIPRSPRAATSSGRSRRARSPPWIAGCRVFTRPSSISGKPVTVATSVTGSPAAVRARAVPPVEISATPRAISAPAKGMIPVLSLTEMSARWIIGAAFSSGEGQRHARRRERQTLADGERRFVEIVDQLVEEPVPVDLSSEMHEHRAEADRCAVHKDELPRRSDPTKTANIAVDALGHAGAVGSAPLFLNQPFAIVEQRAIDEQGPAIEHLDHLARQIAKTPALISVDGEVAIVALQGTVEIDDAAHKRGSEDADTAKIEQVDRSPRCHRVVAEMRVAMNYPVTINRHIPDPKHPQRNLIAVRQRGFCSIENRRPVEPGHRQQPAG